MGCGKKYFLFGSDLAGFSRSWSQLVQVERVEGRGARMGMERGPVARNDSIGDWAWQFLDGGFAHVAAAHRATVRRRSAGLRPAAV